MATQEFNSLVIALFSFAIILCDSTSAASPIMLPSHGIKNPEPTPLGPLSELDPFLSSEPDPTSPIPKSPKLSFPALRPRAIKAAYWPAGNGFPASSIDTSYFTHIYYAFLLPEPNTYKVNVTSFDKHNLPEFTKALHASNSAIKILLSFGGAGNDPRVFSKMASNASTRAIFINSTIEVARRYGVDGVDLDWEFPANNTDMANLALLYKQWREALENEAGATNQNRILLTSVVYYTSEITLLGNPRSYPGKAVAKYLDWINPMCYDYHGSWEHVTGEHSALIDPSSNVSTSFGIQSWMEAGVPHQKIVLGLALYGHTWKLQDPNMNGLGAAAVGPGPGGGELSYAQILDFNAQKNATIKFDTQNVSFYSFAGDSWIGYDDVDSIKSKVRFAQSQALGGYFFWALGLDKNWTISRAAADAWIQ